jgi:hypothetical protein
MADLMDEREERAIRQEYEDLWRHLHEATAEVFGFEPFPAGYPEPLGPPAWSHTGALAGDALGEALEYLCNHLSEVDGGDVPAPGDGFPDPGWSFRAVREIRDVCEALLRRHARWNLTGSGDAT